jgi:hypothetical protein
MAAPAVAACDSVATSSCGVDITASCGCDGERAAGVLIIICSSWVGLEQGHRCCPTPGHDPARHDPGRSPRDHAPSSRCRPHRQPHRVHDRLSNCCVKLRRVIRIAHLLIEGTWASVYAASSPLAPLSSLCRSAHLRPPTASHPATVQRDASGLKGERPRRHRSCPCHPPATPLTPRVHVTRVAPMYHNAAASVAAGAEEQAEDDGGDAPALAPSCPDGPPGAPPCPPEAATPHAPLSLLKGEALTTAPGTDRPLVCAR